MAKDNNPIQSVGGTPVPPPSAKDGYRWSLQDISKAGSGRTEDGLMHKQRIGQKVKLKLSWKNIPTEQASVILRAFNPDYIDVTYLDPMAGGYQTKNFYVGDRSAPMYSHMLNVWSNISFDIIER